MDDDFDYSALVEKLKASGTPVLQAISEASTFSRLHRKLESEIYRLKLREQTHEFQINVLTVMVVALFFLLLFVLSRMERF
ncbi:hypothetical protein NX773_13675 [Massilia solisilvae]|uniref:Uncharacterized protein n=1 Tax=Massilia solisilvae TaxID=1811225 RepID=A0ABT2BL65_9BURK|nr:hypothetical protein [Massilia solisilvae]MCS0609217.1 hypothetical protein [Massilia solisilvae]